jgi:uncharacterized protein (TIGR02145 family)
MKSKLLVLFSIPIISFSQTPGGGVSDVDGNNYSTVIIGTQEWMAENLRTSSYSNSDPIPNVTDGNQWASLTAGAWAHYNNDNQYENPYGKLYNWYTITDSSNVCPTGWHMPTDAEYTLLTDYLGGGPVAGGKMKSIGTQYWLSPNTYATNESGFSGLPGGYHTSYGTFDFIGYGGFWWSSTQDGTTSSAWFHNLLYGDGNVGRNPTSKAYGLSVRCIKGVPLGLIELKDTQKTLSKIIDLTGREIQYQKNTMMIYVYEDGTSERVIEFE